MPTERENADRPPAPNVVDFRTPGDPQATSDEKAQQIVDAGVAVDSVPKRFVIRRSPAT